MRAAPTIIIACPATSIMAGFALAETIYVATSGDDTNGDGTLGNPYRTIQKGIDEAIHGDTVLVADGIYTGAGNVNLDFYAKHITVKSENGPANCIVDCENMDDILQAAYNDHKKLPGDATAKGQEWHFTVRPYDGEDMLLYSV